MPILQFMCQYATGKLALSAFPHYSN